MKKSLVEKLSQLSQAATPAAQTKAQNPNLFTTSDYMLSAGVIPRQTAQQQLSKLVRLGKVRRAMVREQDSLGRWVTISGYEVVEGE